MLPVPSQSLYSDLAMEITKLKSNGETWWTIGFDLFTEQDHSFFDQLIEIFPVLHIEVDLKKEWSYGYPRWLSQVVK